MSCLRITPANLSDSASLPSSSTIAAKSFVDAACDIELRASQSSSEDTSPGSQAGAVEAWARSTGRLIASEEIDVLPLVSNNTSEHEVFFRQWEGRAVKRTWPGVYGRIPAPIDGGVGQKNARPTEYLRRMLLQILLFDTDLALEGATLSNKPPMVLFQPFGQPSFVISQRWFERVDKVMIEEIRAFMQEAGFVFLPKAFFGWYRPDDRIVIIDAKPDNFIKTAVGLVPFDLQLAQFSEEEMRAANL